MTSAVTRSEQKVVEAEHDVIPRIFDKRSHSDL